MDPRNPFVLIAVGIVILLGATWYYIRGNINTAENTYAPTTSQQPSGGHEESPPPVGTVSARAGEDALATFACANGTTMTAVFMRDLVDLTLSDGRQITLTQVESGSGIRYANETGSIEFHSKGEEAFLTEGGDTTYADCKAAL